MRLLILVLALLLGCQDEGAPAPQPIPGLRLNLNRATVEELEKLPAIGPKHARSIIASRNARGGRFDSIEQLLQIDGIGPKTVEEIRPYVELGPPR